MAFWEDTSTVNGMTYYPPSPRRRRNIVLGESLLALAKKNKTNELRIPKPLFEHICGLTHYSVAQSLIELASDNIIELPNKPNGRPRVEYRDYYDVILHPEHPFFAELPSQRAKRLTVKL